MAGAEDITKGEVVGLSSEEEVHTRETSGGRLLEAEVGTQEAPGVRGHTW